MSLLPKLSKYLLVSALISVVAALLISCGLSDAKDVDNQNPSHWPKKLRMAYYVDDEHPGMRSEATKHFANYLTKRLNLPVEVFKTTEYGPMIEAMRGGKLDINHFGTFAYLLAHEKAGAENIICRADPETGQPSQYHSIIVVRTDSPLQSFEDLKANASDITYAFVNPASTSGHLIPRAYMEQNGLIPEEDFKELIYPRRQNATLRTILTGKVDAGSCSINTYRKLVRLGRLSEDEVRILWKSPPIPSGSISVRSSLPEDLKARIQQVLSEVHIKYPEDWEKMKKLHQYSSDPEYVYTKSDDSLFDEVRELARSIKNLDMLN
ncbi:MAG: phosphate/phosphite/phosphonate ABC transporter substrate-binding protein [Opitutales bacterium]|nr:phosphate/phosphite/phosphonate ABC transporter substrate-binding protein [Opitutales bacterium]